MSRIQVDQTLAPPDGALPVPSPTWSIDGIMLPELLTRCLDFMDLDDILRIMAINKRWNALGLAHPTYWRDLYLELSQGVCSRHVRLFRLRLSRSHGRPINVRTSNSYTTRYDPRVSAERDVLSDISTHLSHIQVLHWRTQHHTAVGELFDALAHPAPMLQELALSSPFWTPPWPALRADLLAGFAPALRLAVFSCLELPVPLSACLSNIDRLSVHNGTVPDVVQESLRLRALYLCDQVILPDIFRTEAAWNGIQGLHIFGGEIASNWRGMRLPIDRVPRVVLQQNYTYPSEHAGIADNLAGLASHLQGAIGLYVVQSTTSPGVHRFQLRGTSERTHHLERSMVTAQNVGKIPEPPPTAIAAGFAHRIVYLTVRLKSWDPMLHLGPLPALEDLVLLIANESPPEAPGTLSCPALKRLIIRERRWRADKLVVTPVPLERFARQALLGVKFPLALDLQGVELQKDAECDQSRFCNTTMTGAPADFSFFALAAIVAAVPAQAALVYNGENCEGDRLNVTHDGACHDGFWAQSFNTGTTACLRVYSHPGCQETGQRFTYPELGDFCRAANNGQKTQSFRVWAGPKCPPAFND
ncbi:hypothetical protein AURDEDRAFT_165580 [Auricularia subglabra TFB-10046 SS5]|nr:hypothetical protein AURDEDRAFT_165580 [Auricularia subglabra TFB-10046 SS5]